MSYIKNKERQLKKQQRNKSGQRHKKRQSEVQKNMQNIQAFEKQMFASQKKPSISSRSYKRNNQSKSPNTQYANQQRENKIKGDAYEIYLIDHFKSQGYIVVEHGLLHGKKDRGIDIILRKDNENFFIQAKSWKNGGRQIDHTMIKAFIGDVAFYIEDNPAFGVANIKRYYITANDVLDSSAKNFIREHKDKVEHLIIPMP